MTTFARRELWDDLSRRRRRGDAADGWDKLGEWVLARWNRRGSRAARLERANRVHAAMTAMDGLDEFAFNRRIAAAREEVRLGRDAAGAVEAAVAVAGQAVRRTLGFTLHPEQLMGGLVMSEGAVAEMATGEGKTVTAVLPSAIDGWLGRGVHVHTVNDYLARRDAEITGPVYKRLGLTVDAIQDPMGPPERRRCYSADVTYGTAQQFIFDYLRDRVAMPLAPTLTSHLLDQVGSSGRDADGVVQRGLFAAVVDEADSVLVDEATTPAILAERVPETAGAREHRVAVDIARRLVEGRDFEADVRSRLVSVTEAGRERLAEFAESLPPFWSGPRRREELVLTALTALHLYRRGDDYVVQNGSVQLVDRSTGRVLEGREWQLGLHQAVECKEGIEASGDKRITARTGYQRFFQRYRRLSGMSGTIWEVRDEIWNNFGLPVVRVPTHRPVIREHVPDVVLEDEASKFGLVVERVRELHRVGRPVLVGTRSVIASNRLALAVGEAGIACRVLNAELEADEAEIVASAGERGAVTVATNMAGRGTDIKLGEGVLELGGLVVIATERHAERRVDRQLYGRSGRQGDPGRAETYVSLEDALLHEHASALVRRIVAGVLRIRGGSGQAAARAVWSLVQQSASRHMATRRDASSRSEAQRELAHHRETR
ncbi:MAG: hypothetical protein AAF108_03195 [Planctomycetota bacterium]